MGFMTGERYQCQDCEEILIVPLEFDSVEAYLEFLKVQNPKKFAEIESELKEWFLSIVKVFQNELWELNIIPWNTATVHYKMVHTWS